MQIAITNAAMHGQDIHKLNVHDQMYEHKTLTTVRFKTDEDRFGMTTTLMTGSSRHESEPNSLALAVKPPPKGV